MKSCLNCKHAEWKRTANGRLHPSGDGMCKYPYKMPPLPASMYWAARPYVCGGSISRKVEHKDHCVYFAREEKA